MTPAFRTICLLIAVAAATAGCGAPLYKARPELAARKKVIRSMGLLPPDVTLYEEPALSRVIPHDDWSRKAAETVSRAFIEEMAAGGMSVTAIDGEDPELSEMLDLFGAVQFSILRHVYPNPFNLKEEFPQKARSFDYSLGPAGPAMERHRVDAVWIVTGVNLLPTTGERVLETVEVLAGMFSYSGPMIHQKHALHAALVDRDGTILFYCPLDEFHLRQAEGSGSSDLSTAMDNPGSVPEEPLGEDLRDRKLAGRYIRALISEYRKAAGE